MLVDISGFTTLSEQLAATGREGTEQLIATLSRIFTVLLPATDDGGDVVKFAGDALLVLFTGDDHAKHAVHAAWNMNRVLAAIGDIHLPNARTRLRMSVGVHSGTFELFLTGTDYVSVVMTGRDTSRVLELQGAASAGQILVSDQTAAFLPAKQVAADPGTPGAHRLLRAGSIATASLMALSAGRGAAADRFLPRAFGQRPDLLDGEPDHRWAAIGFVQVSGVPDAPDADDVAAMAELTAQVEAAVADTGATLLDVDPAPGGYRYFLTAGAPTTVEDPEGRLLTAVQRIVTAASPYALRAGVASGRVFAGFVGATYRQTYTVMGDSTNLAARLTARAAPGTVLVARGALERSVTVFDVEDGGELTLKGKTHPVPVAVVTRPGHRPDAEPEAPFVGREAELKKLRALRDAAADGFGGAVTIVAGAGAGKSRLLARALEGTTMRIVRADGDRYAAAAPYRTLQALLRPLLDIPADASAIEAGAALIRAVERRKPALLPWLPLLAPTVGAEVDPTDAVDALDDSFRQERAHAVLGRLMEDLLPASTCVIVDDAHWVDDASAAALAHVFGGDTVHAVYLARRDVPGGLEIPGQRVALEGLPHDDAGDLVEALMGRPLLPSDLMPVLARAGGNPLYLTELAAGLSAGSETLGIEQLIGERIDALTESERAVVRRAAVLGWGVPLSLFVRCVGPVELAETEGVAGFLELLEDSVRFRNELFHDVAYEQLNYQTRRELHRAVAAILVAEPELAAGPVDAMLTVHYEAAGDWAHAEESAVRTAEAAEANLAIDDALRAYRVAVAAAGRLRPPPARLPGLWESLGRVSVASGRANEGLEAFEKARKLNRDAAARARIDRQRAYALNVLGRPDEARGTLKQARRAAVAAGASGRGILASIAVTDAGVRLRQAHWAEARALAVEAIGLLEGAAVTDDDKRVLADAFRYHDIAASELEGDDG
ncbi:MAG TPA: adenylate/guanylate cyclase domain-containing protein, partial [Microbacterium sp.]|nr:adenylate/guanylate cyclase domain-containing protein [Microbacterium sp.]